MRSKLFAGLAGFGVLAMMFTAPAAVASSDEKDVSLNSLTAAVSGKDLAAKYKGIYVVGGLDQAGQSGEAEFYAIPESEKDALFVSPDLAADLGLVNQGKVSRAEETAAFDKLAKKAAGESPQSQKTTKDTTVSTLAATASSCWTSFYTPLWGWSGEYQRVCSHISSSGYYYSWSMDPGNSTQSCNRGLGYYQGYNGGSFGLWANWYNIGCGRSATTYVPWDNVSAYPKLMSSSMNGLGGFGKFI